ncbi:MAG TPA: PQQ-binding-like beta-propeller repeat protein, partial [Lacipirellulaceae bacterium]|nr:PQQ-binding-like beta-propeller repeat protein [Lacipirellulaceae bacterium]
MGIGRWALGVYTPEMLKKVAFVVAVLLLLGGVVLGALLAAGYRVAVDGSGKWPRFLTRTDYDALEADRARQQEAPSSTAAEASTGAMNAKSEAQSVPARGSETGARPVGASATATTAEETSAATWTDFRGPNRDGRYAATPIRTNWPREGLPRLWKQPVGGGYASFVVADGRAFTIEQRRNQEVVAAYDVRTGREVWTNGWNANFQESMGGDGPRATPTYHEGRIYALGAEGELRALDAGKGSLIWRKNILTDNNAGNLQWGMSAAPLIVDDKVIVLPGGRSGKSIAAYNKDTGAPVWKSLNDQQSYTSPMLVTLAGRRQIVLISAPRALGVAVEGGSLLWQYPWV